MTIKTTPNDANGIGIAGETRTYPRETDQCLFDESGRRTAKVTDWHAWHPTRDNVGGV